MHFGHIILAAGIFFWLGLALGISHLSRSGSKATALGIAATVVWFAAPPLLKNFAGGYPALRLIFPGGVEDALWRSSLEPVAYAALWLAALGLMYLSVGAAVFARRDAR